MTLSFHATAGQVALVEPDRSDPRQATPATGVVAPDGDDLLHVIGVSWPEMLGDTDVVVSIFAPEALYRLHATARWAGSGRLTIDPIRDVERIQRRRWPRHPIHLDVTLTPLDGPDAEPTSLIGRTIDMSVGGIRVETSGHLPPGADPTVILTMPAGPPLVARTTVVYAETNDHGSEYRLVFDELDEIDLNRLTALVGQAVAPIG
jgi:hypothetical protein